MSSTFTYNLNDLLLCQNDDDVWPDCLSVLLHHLTEYTNELVLIAEPHISNNLLDYNIVWFLHIRKLRVWCFLQLCYSNIR